MTTELTKMSRSELIALINETEESLADIKAELQRRQEAAQHDEIDNLELHLENSEFSLSTIRAFFAHVLDALRKQ